MKHIKQLLVILAISFCGEILRFLIPLPIPASIYGMVLLFTGLMTGIISIDAVKDTGKFLIEIMPIMFIPAGVGLLESFGILKPILGKVSLITVVSLIIAMVVTGRVSQFLIRRENRKTQQKGEHR